MKYAGQTHQTTNTILLLSISFSIPPQLDGCYIEPTDPTCAPVFFLASLHSPMFAVTDIASDI